MTTTEIKPAASGPGSRDPQPTRREDLRDLTPTFVIVGVMFLVIIIAVAVDLAVRSSGTKGDITVHETDYKIAMPSTLHAGKHTFAVTNNGAHPHELVVFRTDLAASAVPLDAHGDMNEESPLVHSVADSGSSLKPGELRSVSTSLRPGHYVAVCNLPGHYQLGMRFDITVTK